MQSVIRVTFALTGIGCIVLAIGYFSQAPWALASWPWADGRLSNIFVSSVLAAMALPLLWIAYSGQFSGAVTGFIHLGAMLAGAASVLIQLGQERADGTVALYGFAAVAGTLICAALAWWGYRQPARDKRPLPRSLRIWFALYIAILIPPGVALLQHSTAIMPWPIKPESGLIYGWVFLAATCSFVYPLWRGQIEYAYVGLWGFLAYDLVLIPPFVALFENVQPQWTTSLTLYLTAMVTSTAVSVWYLFVCRATRVSRSTPAIVAT